MPFLIREKGVACSQYLLGFDSELFWYDGHIGIQRSRLYWFWMFGIRSSGLRIKICSSICSNSSISKINARTFIIFQIYLGYDVSILGFGTTPQQVVLLCWLLHDFCNSAIAKVNARIFNKPQIKLHFDFSCILSVFVYTTQQVALLCFLFRNFCINYVV